MNNVIITVEGIQHDKDGEESRIELAAMGKRYNKGDIYYIIYEEAELSGMEGVKTLLKVSKDRVILVRTGSAHQYTQEYYTGQKHNGVYVTPYGEIPLSVYTQSLEIAMHPTFGKIIINYSLELGGNHSNNRLNITVQGESNSGH